MVNSCKITRKLPHEIYFAVDLWQCNVEAAAQLSFELMKGRLSGENNGWIGKGQMRDHFAEKMNV